MTWLPESTDDSGPGGAGQGGSGTRPLEDVSLMLVSVEAVTFEFCYQVKLVVSEEAKWIKLFLSSLGIEQSLQALLQNRLIVCMLQRRM